MTRWLCVGVVALALGCGGSSHPGPTGTCDPAQYPCGPFGFSAGGVIENVSLIGRRDLDGNGNPLDDAMQPIHLADYFQDKSLRALVLPLGAVWCVPCRNEQPALLALYQQYRAQHVAFLEVIVQDQPGAPAGGDAVDAWAATYHVAFDIAGDPSAALASYYDPNAFPVQMVVRTADMKIMTRTVGQADASLAAAIDAALAP
jgi:hypothetical protein